MYTIDIVRKREKLSNEIHKKYLNKEDTNATSKELQDLMQTRWTPITDSDTIVDKEYLEQLEEASRKLEALEATGVDNWEGYSIAMGALDEY